MARQAWASIAMSACAVSHCAHNTIMQYNSALTDISNTAVLDQLRRLCHVCEVDFPTHAKEIYLFVSTVQYTTLELKYSGVQYTLLEEIN